MNNSNFDYSYQYSNWHSDTPESRSRDIANEKHTFDTHSIYPPEKNAKILEIGCGMGRAMLMLRSNGYENLTGIDIDKSQIEIAKKEKLNVKLSDAEDFLKNTNDIYDAIYMIDILEHIEKSEQLPLLKSIHEHLSENGFLFIRVPNAMSPTMGYFRYTDFTHNVSYTDKTLIFLLHNADFHFCSVRPQHQEAKEIQELKLPWARLYRNEFGLKDFILTPNIVAVAHKNADAHARWQKSAPEIHNDYAEILAEHETASQIKEKPRGLKRLWKIIFGKGLA